MVDSRVFYRPVVLLLLGVISLELVGWGGSRPALVALGAWAAVFGVLWLAYNAGREINRSLDTRTQVRESGTASDHRGQFVWDPMLIIFAVMTVVVVFALTIIVL